MSVTGDYGDEMSRRTDLDDETIEAVLSGRQVAGEDQLVSFVEDVHFVANEGRPTASHAVAALFVKGVSRNARDLPAMATSMVSGPPQLDQLQQRKKHNVGQIARSKLASIGVAAKVGFATGAFALAGTAAAATGTLPDAVQDRVADAADRVGITIPGGQSAGHRQDGGHRQDADRRQDAEHRPDDAPGGADRQQTPANEFGKWVSSQATSGVPQEDGRQFGEDVSTRAREQSRPSGTPTPDNNPGTERRPSAAGSGSQPSAPPAAPQENRDSDRHEAALGPARAERDRGAAKPADSPSADDNPGTERRP